MSTNIEIKDYRQPMVTSLGIIMGFILSFLATWSISSDKHPIIQTIDDWCLLVSFTIGLCLMVLVLYRILSPTIESKNPTAYYTKTLKIFIVAILISFVGLLLSLVI